MQQEAQGEEMTGAVGVLVGGMLAMVSMPWVRVALRVDAGAAGDDLTPRAMYFGL